VTRFKPLVDVAALTGKLQKLGFNGTDVNAALRATGGAATSGRDSTNTALDWLCLNVPEARLPKRFAPNAKSEPIVLLNTAAAFAPAGQNPSAAAAAAAAAGGASAAAASGGGARGRVEEARPEDPDAAWLWERGYTAGEAAAALVLAGGSAAAGGAGASAGLRSAALEALFRDVLKAAAPEGADWDAWPASAETGDGAAEGPPGGGEEDEVGQCKLNPFDP
jgi:hypothetical protein